MLTYLLLKQKSFMTFCYLTQSNQQKKNQKEVIELQKMEGNLSKKCQRSVICLWVYLQFIRERSRVLLRFWISWRYLFLRSVKGAFFAYKTLENPLFCALYPWKFPEFSWKKRWKIQKNTLGNPSKPRNLNLKFAWQPWFLTCVWPFYRL